MSNSIKGYILGSLAAASYGTNPLFAMPLINAGMILVIAAVTMIIARGCINGQLLRVRKMFPHICKHQTLIFNFPKY